MKKETFIGHVLTARLNILRKLDCGNFGRKYVASAACSTLILITDKETKVVKYFVNIQSIT